VSIFHRYPERKVCYPSHMSHFWGHLQILWLL
jgi:hypothetical protein